MSEGDSQVKRSVVIYIRKVDLCTSPKQDTCRFDLPIASRFVEGSISAIILNVSAESGVEQ